MSDAVSATVRRFDLCEAYEQEEPGDAEFRWVLKKDELPGICAGLVTLKGPIHKTPGVHDEWDQVYLIFSGRATAHLAGQSHRITGPSAVIIPKGTEHSIQVDAGEELQYVYLNHWR